MNLFGLFGADETKSNTIYYLIIFALFVFIYLLWVGWFKKMNLRRVKFESSECFYRPYCGPYEKELGNEFKRVVEEVQNHSIAFRAFNRKEYYDDPEKYVDHSKLRADIGFLVTTVPFLEKEKTDLIKDMEKMGYTYAKFEEAECLHDVFPFRWPKFIAFVLGAKKFYSKLRQFMINDSSILKGINEGPGFAAFETYSPNEIGFYFPLEKVRQFYLTKLTPPGTKDD